MPLQYAIQEPHPTIKKGPESVEYFSVPRDIAETHEKGCYALFNEDGVKVSPWALLNREIPPFKASTRTEVKDVIQQPLFVGDYVSYNNGGMLDPLTIGRVLGFTNKQVRVMSMSMYPRTGFKLHYEQSLIKLPQSLWEGMP